MTRNFFEVTSRGQLQISRKMFDGIGLCQHTMITRDSSSGLYYYICMGERTPNFLRMIEIKPKLDESKFEDILSRFNIDLSGCDYFFVENKVLYFHWVGGVISGYEIKSGKKVYQNQNPIKFESNFVNYFSKKVFSTKLIKI
jgi:hypothetical protein